MFFSTIFLLAPEKNLLCAAVNQADLKPLPEKMVCQNQGTTLKGEKIQQINSRLGWHTGNSPEPVVHQMVSNAAVMIKSVPHSMKLELVPSG